MSNETDQHGRTGSWLLDADEKKKREERERQERIRNNADAMREYRIKPRTYDPFRKRATTETVSPSAPRSQPLPPTRSMDPVIIKLKKPILRKDGEFADVLMFDERRRKKKN